MVEHAVEDDAHAALMQFAAEGSEEDIAALQVFQAGHPADIFGGGGVVLVRRFHDMVVIVDNDAEMGIDMLVILAVILMAGGGDEDRVQVQDADAQVI